ncbi:MAG: cyclic nucleotide-binding domain-containing protein [Bdellovibrionota bacterium]
MSGDNSKKLKKGGVLIREGDAVENIYLIKSGRVTLFVERSGKKIELGQLNAGQIIGEKALFGPSKMSFSVLASNEVTYLEVPLKLIEPMFAGLSGIIKGVTKGVVDSLTDTRKALQSIKMETDAIPCGQKFIAKVFATIYMTTNMTGTKKDDYVQVAWNTLKLYSNRIFLEPHSRVLSVIEILTKLKYAEMIYTKNDEGEEEFSDIKFFNVKIIEEFSDFYQYQFYKPGRSEVIYIDKLAMKIVGGLVALSENAEVDHKRAVNLDYELLFQDMKAKFNIELKTNHFELLEKKGLFAQKKSRNDKVFLMFDREEFKRTHIMWQIIHEIDKWNDLGYVKMVEEEEKKTVATGGMECPSCSGAISAEHKFCPHCGQKTQSSAAA